MIKIDIFSGFLGAGKTTLVKKLINEAYKGEKLVLIENEFGEIGIDGGFLKDAGVEINEMNSGCICCSLVGDFGKAIQKVIDDFAPERILIEPSGVGKLSDIVEAVENLKLENVQINALVTVVDAKKARIFFKNFGEFFNNQIESAKTIVMSHTAGMAEDRLEKAVALVREHNAEATLITTDWEQLTGAQILEAMEPCPHCGEHHHGHEHHHEHHHDEECCCGHDHDHHEHHHEHHHDHHECDDPNCECHHHDRHEHHGHHGHHHADEVFTSWGVETTRKFTKTDVERMLTEIQAEEKYGVVLRAKGIVAGEDAWIHFDYVPGEPDVREGCAGVTGRLCVIGCNLNEAALKELFKA
jgi:G3E family GTPase